MAKFQRGNPGGPGRPRLDAQTKRAREIIKATLIPALPDVLDRILASRHPKVLLDGLRVLLPYVDVRESETVNVKLEQHESSLEQTFREIWEERERRRVAAAQEPTTHQDDSPGRTASPTSGNSVT